MASALLVENRSPSIKDLSFGGSGLAGIYTPVSHETAVQTLRTALEKGFTSFDTAPHYGAGLSEEYFGEVLTKASTPLCVSTKVGRIIKKKAECKKDDPRVVWDNDDCFKHDGTPTDKVPVYDYSSEGVKESYRQSSERMKGLKISCLRLHDAETEEFFEEATREGWAVDTLVKMREEGLVEHISLGMNRADFLLRYIRKYPVGTFDNILVAGCWNLLDHSGYELLHAKGISVTLAGIFGSGLLWGGHHLRYTPAQQPDIERRDKWAANKHGCTLPGVALAFSFLPSCVNQLCIGCQTPEQLDQNIALLNEKVPLRLWAEAKQEGLLPDWVPIPQ